MKKGNYYSSKNDRKRYLSKHIFNRNCSRSVLKMHIVHGMSFEFGSVADIFILKGDPIKETEPLNFC